MLKCPNGINKTYLVSFPRSGHHLLVRGLQRVMEHKLIYSEFYTVKHNFSTCRFVNLQKSHDFDLQQEIKPDYKYVVLIRNMEDALISWWKTTDRKVKLANFIRRNEKYYLDFMMKWSNPAERKVIDYDWFIWNKYSVIESCCELMGHTPNPMEIKEFVKSEKR